MKKYLLIGLAAALVLGWLVWDIRSRQAHRRRITALEQELASLKEAPAQAGPFSKVVTPYPDEQAESPGESPTDRD